MVTLYRIMIEVAFRLGWTDAIKRLDGRMWALQYAHIVKSQRRVF